MTKTLTIVEEIAALQAMTAPALVERYQAAFGRPPRSKQPAWLRSRLAWRLQEQRLGGLSRVATRRLDELIAGIELPTEKTKATRTTRAPLRDDAADRLRVGTVLTREWHGREVRVTVLERGFDCEGVPYRSLSAVAKAITGSHWNGRLFFGLAPRRRKS
ncbi:MAG: DUF2924 domain-containing protein [Phycisphaerales bacterium]|nr:DUF2924 domain-containing protein [Phycisphaerales bacterium]